MCTNAQHRDVLSRNWDTLSDSIVAVGKQIFGFRSKNENVVPGWNRHIRDFYDASREAFLYWKSNGSPRNGPIAYAMRSARANFKYALRQCRAEENRMRADSLAEKLTLKDGGTSFWKDIRKLQPRNKKLPTSIDDKSGENSIAELWKEKFKGVLNCIDLSDDLVLFNNEFNRMNDDIILGVDAYELRSVMKNLKADKAIGKDLIPNEFYKYCDNYCLVILSLFFNAFLSHTFLPSKISDALIVPLLKDKSKDAAASSNYRPISINTAASKIFERIILNRIENNLSTEYNQFGFKKHHSTDMCIWSFKEIVTYYQNLNSSVFACFIDIKSAFDKVNYVKLFQKLIERNVPKYIIKVLYNWYVQQKIYVKWGNCLSHSFFYDKWYKTRISFESFTF